MTFESENNYPLNKTIYLNENNYTETSAPPVSLADILNTPVQIFIPGEGSGASGDLPPSMPVLPPDASVEQLQEVVKSKKPTCVGIQAFYSCGSHDAVPQYSGPIISVSSGDEVAMNSMLLTIVSIDGAGNGEGLIQVPMFGNLKMGVKLSGIQVAEGGCVVAGRAEVSEVSASLLNDKLRAELAKAYAAFVETTDMAIKNAGAIAETINGIKDFLGKAKAFARNYKGGDADAAKAKAYAEYGDKVKNTLLNSSEVPQEIKNELQNAIASAAPAWEFYKSGQPCSTGGKGPFFGGFEDCDAYTSAIDGEMAALEKAEGSISKVPPFLMDFPESTDSPSNDKILTEAQLRDALSFGGEWLKATYSNGEIAEYKEWNGIYVIKYKGERYWYYEGSYYIEGTCLKNQDPSTARASFKKCINKNNDGTCTYECVDMETGTGLGGKIADLMARGFVFTLSSALMVYTAPTMTIAAAEVSLDAFAEYIDIEKPTWGNGTMQVILAFNVYLATKGKPKLSDESIQGLSKALDDVGQTELKKWSPENIKKYFSEALNEAKKKVNAWRGNDVRDILEKYKVAVFDKLKIIAKDESLPPSVKNSFLDTYYYTAEIMDDIKVFRRFGGEDKDQAKLFGSYTSTEALLKRDELAIMTKWNSMQYEAELIVEKGTKLNLGKVAPYGKYAGGADQVLLPYSFSENWVKNITDLKTGKVYNFEEFKLIFPDLIKK